LIKAYLSTPHCISPSSKTYFQESVQQNTGQQAIL
jgi:hypothetical protein